MLRMFLVSSHCRVHLIVNLALLSSACRKRAVLNIRLCSMGWAFLPCNGPVMQKKTVKWEPSTEMMYMCGGELKGDVNMALLLEDGSHHRCDFKSTYK